MKAKTFYRDIFKKAYMLTLKNKLFWFLGLFAAPLIGIGEYKVITQSLQAFSTDNAIVKWYPIVATGVFKVKTLRYLGQQFIMSPGAIFLLLLIVTLIVLFIILLIWLVVVAQGSIINATDQVSSKRLVGSKLSQYVSVGVRNFWSVLGINAFVKLIIYLLLLLLSLPFIVTVIDTAAGGINMFFIISALIFIPIAVVAAFIGKYAINYIVIEKESFEQSIKKGYRLFIDNWFVTIEMSLILLFVSIVATAVLAVVGSLAILPFIALSYIVAQLGIQSLMIVMMFLMLFLFMALGVFFVAILSTFYYSCWVLLFKKLHSGEEKVLSKVARWFGNK